MINKYTYIVIVCSEVVLPIGVNNLKSLKIIALSSS